MITGAGTARHLPPVNTALTMLFNPDPSPAAMHQRVDGQETPKRSAERSLLGIGSTVHTPPERRMDSAASRASPIAMQKPAAGHEIRRSSEDPVMAGRAPRCQVPPSSVHARACGTDSLVDPTAMHAVADVQSRPST